MTKYDVTLRDAKTGHERKLETIIRINNYDADDYIRDCDRDYDDEWCEMIKEGEIIITPVYDEVMILMEDGCTKSEAERYLKNGTVIFDSIDEYKEEFKRSATYEVDDICINTVYYGGHVYCIMYVR